MKNSLKQFVKKIIDTRNKKKSAKKNFDVEKFRNHLTKSCHNFEAMEGTIRSSSDKSGQIWARRERISSADDIFNVKNDEKKLQRGLMRKSMTQSTRYTQARRELNYSKRNIKKIVYRKPDENYFLYLVI